jgi:flavin-dependent dehydrogenase
MCALMLARSGVEVDLIDPSGFPRDKACGDLLGSATVSLLHAAGLEDLLVGGHPITAHHHVTVDHRPLATFESDADRPPPSVMLRRFVLDAALHDAACRAGAVPVQATFVGFEPSEPTTTLTVLLDTADTTIERTYAYVVGADGARSTVARKSGLFAGLGRDHAIAIRRYVVGPHGLGHTVAFFQPEAGLPPGPAYSWAFPVDARRLNIGVGAPPGTGQAAKSRLDRFQVALQTYLALDEPLVADGPLRGGIIRYDFDLTRITTDRVFLVGDAAGATEGIGGEGIHNALLSGQAVAEAIVEHFGSSSLPSDVVEAYETTIFHEVLAARHAVRTGGSIFDQAPKRTTDRSAASWGFARWKRPGSGSVTIPAGCVAHVEVIGGGGGGGHRGGSAGRAATIVNGVIPPRDAPYELLAECGAGGGCGIDDADHTPEGSRGGGGPVPGGAGGWGSGATAGAGGGGGGASALRTGDGSIRIVAPGGGGGGGGPDPSSARVAAGGDHHLPEAGSHGHDGVAAEDAAPGGTSLPPVESGGRGDATAGGDGTHGVTWQGHRGGGGGGGGGGVPGGGGGAGGRGGAGGNGGNGAALSIGLEQVDVRVRREGDGRRPSTVPAAGSGGGADARSGRPGADGLVHVHWTRYEGPRTGSADADGIESSSCSSASAGDPTSPA